MVCLKTTKYGVPIVALAIYIQVYYYFTIYKRYKMLYRNTSIII